MTPEKIAKLPYRPCVGVVLLNDKGAVFTGQRNDRHREAWQMPQGGVEKGESPREAALRELEEETGVPKRLVEVVAETDDWLPYDLPVEIVPHIWGGKYRGQEQKWVLMRFLGADSDVNIATAHPEFSTWRWTPPGALLMGVVPFKRDVYARVLEAFAAHLD